MGFYACDHLQESDICAFDADVCNGEECGFIADVLNPLVNNHLGIHLDCCVPCGCCRFMVVLTEGRDPCPLDREICA